ncbi:SIMPL domain-containing protein [Altererythrobacter sp. H2]|uniref:SIMPL domain-containing protein n=1 Tax=Altererythrobacter sp. H2 TaxID=3108391 RepID=UPI002B4BD0EF|nr:SIMPL domain-containing protein [Altererythrobacter sp. H2]WRK95074.1 SIMPL domain-containing protein [Altererythrobacter sp. H2]
MTRIALPLAALTMAASPLAAAEVTVTAQGPIVELSVTETVKGRPDLVEVGAGVTTEAATAVEAMRLNAEQMARVVQRIRSLGIAADDVQTTGINLNAAYDYNGQRQVFRGYQASNRVSVTLRKVDETGRILDALVAAGATDLSGPSFSIEDDTAAQAQARKAAVEKAGAMARQYAEWSGYTGVRVLKISESMQGGMPVPYMRAQAMEASSAPTPVEPGLVGTSVSVSVTYEMTR